MRHPGNWRRICSTMAFGSGSAGDAHMTVMLPRDITSGLGVSHDSTAHERSPPGIYGRGVELDFDGIVPLWEQLAAVLRGRIERGEIPPGRAIPSKKYLVQEFGISPTT